MTDTTSPVETSTQGSADEQPQTQDKVSYETHRRLLDEKKREQAARKQLEAELEMFRAKEKQIEEEKLKQTGEYQKLLQLREEENKKLKSELDSFENRFKRAAKMNAFIKAAGTELDDKWLQLVDVDSIAVRPDDNEIDMMSLQSSVETFRKTWPEAFKPKGSPIPADMPNGQGHITESEWRKLPKAADKTKYKPDQILWGK